MKAAAVVAVLPEREKFFEAATKPLLKAAGFDVIRMPPANGDPAPSWNEGVREAAGAGYDRVIVFGDDWTCSRDLRVHLDELLDRYDARLASCSFFLMDSAEPRFRPGCIMPPVQLNLPAVVAPYWVLSNPPTFAVLYAPVQTFLDTPFPEDGEMQSDARFVTAYAEKGGSISFTQACLVVAHRLPGKKLTEDVS